MKGPNLLTETLLLTYCPASNTTVTKKSQTPAEIAEEKGEGTLDNEATSHDDVFDAFRMSLQFWH